MIFEIILFLVTLGIYIWGLATSEKKKWWLIGGGVGIVLPFLTPLYFSLLYSTEELPFLLILIFPGLLVSAGLSQITPLSLLTYFTYSTLLYGSALGLISRKTKIGYLASVTLLASYFILGYFSLYYFALPA